MSQQSPLRGPEKGMGFHVRGARAGPESAMFVFAEEFADEGFAERGDLRVVGVVGEGRVVAENVGEGCIAVFALEWGCAVLLVSILDGGVVVVVGVQASRRLGFRGSTSRRRRYGHIPL